MVDLIRPSELPEAASVGTNDAIAVDTGAEVLKATPKQITDAGFPIASESQARAGVSNEVAMTPLGVRQAIEALGLTTDFASRSDFVAAAGALSPEMADGTVVTADGLVYRRNSGASGIPDLQGWEGVVPCVGHYGGVNQASLDAMSTDVGYVRIERAYAVGEALNIDYPLTFDEGASFTNDEFSVTIRAPIESTKQFILRGDGTYTLTHGSNTPSGQGENARQIHASWFGVFPNNQTGPSIHTRLQKAFDSLGNAREAVVDFDQGNYPMTAGCSVPRGVWLRGSGRRRTVFFLRGDGFVPFTTIGPAVKMTGCQCEQSLSSPFRESAFFVINHADCEVKDFRGGYFAKNFVVNASGFILDDAYFVYDGDRGADSSCVELGNGASSVSVRNIDLRSSGAGVESVVRIAPSSGQIDKIEVSNVKSVTGGNIVRIDASGTAIVDNFLLENLQWSNTSGVTCPAMVKIKTSGSAQVRFGNVDNMIGNGNVQYAVDFEQGSSGSIRDIILSNINIGGSGYVIKGSRTNGATNNIEVNGINRAGRALLDGTLAGLKQTMPADVYFEGNVYGNILPAPTMDLITNDLPKIAAFFDVMTLGSSTLEGMASRIGALTATQGLSFNPNGYGSDTIGGSAFIAGNNAPTITFTGNTINNGANTVAVSWPWTDTARPAQVRQCILPNGVRGTLARVNDTSGTFTASLPLGPVTVSGPVLCQVVSGLFAQSQFLIFNSGKNNITSASPPTAAWLLQHTREITDAWHDQSRVCVMGHFANTNADSAQIALVLATNTELRNYYGRNYFGLIELFEDDATWTALGLTKTAADILAISEKRLPPSLSRDNGHMSAAMSSYASDRLFAYLVANSFFTSSPASAIALGTSSLDDLANWEPQYNYYQSLSANATPERGYPIARGGALYVTGSPTGFRTQTYVTVDGIAVRHRTSSTNAPVAWNVISSSAAPTDFATRAALVSWAASNTPAVGHVANAGGYAYRYVGSGSEILDLPGFMWEGEQTPQHHGAVANLPNVRLGDITPANIAAATDNSAAFKRAYRNSFDLYIPAGVYKLADCELEVLTTGKRIRGAGGGASEGNNMIQDSLGGSVLVFTGAGTRRRLTRYLSPQNSSQPDDAPISVCVNIQNEGVRHNDILVYAYCDFSDDSPANLGADYDVGILNGTRVDVDLSGCRVLGYNRVANVLIDVTRGTTTAQHLGTDGQPYPDGSVLNGADRHSGSRLVCKGGLKGLYIRGALENATGAYYDYRTGAILSAEGGRGGYGASDGHYPDALFMSRDHHSYWRAVDPVSPLNFDAENMETIAAAVAITGRRGSSTQGRVRKILFSNARIATFEACRVALGNAYEISFAFVQNEPRSTSLVVRDTSGTIIPWSDQTTYNYGPYASKTFSGTQLGTGLTVILGSPVSPNATHFKDPSYVSIAQGNGQSVVRGLRASALTLDTPLPMASAPGRYSITLADDTAATLELGVSVFAGIGEIASNGLTTAASGFRFRAAPASNFVSLNNTTGTVGAYDTALTGTTGADGSLNIGVTQGRVYIENRTGGAAKTFVVSLVY